MKVEFRSQKGGKKKLKGRKHKRRSEGFDRQKGPAGEIKGKK